MEETVESDSPSFLAIRGERVATIELCAYNALAVLIAEVVDGPSRTRAKRTVRAAATVQ